MQQSRAAVIVVGVDRGSSSRAALVFAIAEAGRRTSAVEVVTAWSFAEQAVAPGSLAGVQSRAEAECVQDEAVSAALRSVTAPPLLSRRVLEGWAGDLLVAAARHADYLVLGRARSFGAQRSLLGSVGDYCVRLAPVPVLVVPEADRRPTVPPTSMTRV